MTDVLIERASLLASLGDLLGEALDGHGRLVFLGGEAGVGKTALATAFAGPATGMSVRGARARRRRDPSGRRGSV